VQRAFEVLYLDERLRVGRFQPEDSREPQLFVFRRAGAAGPETEEEEAEVQHCTPFGALLCCFCCAVLSAHVSTERRCVHVHTIRHAYSRAAAPEPAASLTAARRGVQEEEAEGEEEAAAPARKRGAFGFLNRQKPAAAAEEEGEDEDGEDEAAPKAAPRATQRRGGGAPPPPPADEPCAPRQRQCSWQCVENLACCVCAGVRGAPAGGQQAV